MGHGTRLAEPVCLVDLDVELLVDVVHKLARQGRRTAREDPNGAEVVVLD